MFSAWFNMATFIAIENQSKAIKVGPLIHFLSVTFHMLIKQT